MKIILLGADGMLGHKVYEVLSKSNKFDVYGSFIKEPTNYIDLYNKDKILYPVDVLDLEKLKDIINRIKPDCVINAVGIVKSLKESKNPIISISINALFPHHLLKICNVNNSKVIHISTDCAFSGKKGMYKENDFPDAGDLYGRTKYLGEISYGNSLTLRTSIIGKELGNKHGLLEWFFSQKGKEIKGYRKAIFSGFTTIRFAKIIAWILNNYKDLQGLYHISAKPINKFDLLNRIRDILNLDINIIPCDEPVIDRSLDCTKFMKTVNFIQPTWDEMITEFAEDYKNYDKWEK